MLLFPRRELVQAVLMSSSSSMLAQVTPTPPPSTLIEFYDDVTSESCLQLSRKLREAEEKRSDVRLHIQSHGGSLLSSFQVCDLLEEMTVPVTGKAEGLVASAATLMFVCCQRRVMGKRSVLLLHQASVDPGQVKNEELQDEAYNMNVLTDIMIDTYLSHSSMQRDELVDLLANERYLTSHDAIHYGLVDDIE